MAGEARQTRRVLFGSLIMLGLFAGALLVFFLDDLLRSFRTTYTVVAVVQNAPDLAAGSPVWVAGRQVGSVLTVGFIPAGTDTLSRIAVEMELPRDVRDQVRTDSRVRLTSQNLMSEPVVDISPGSAQARVLEPGDTLRQELRPTPAQLAARAAGVKAGLDTVLVDLRELSPAVRVMLDRTDRAFQGLDLVMQEAALLQQDLDANPGLAMLRDARFRASLERASATIGELPRMLGELRTRDGGTAQVSAALTRLQARADSLMTALAVASDALATPNGTLARLQQDTALQRAITNARAELDSLIADARRNPMRYVF